MDEWPDAQAIRNEGRVIIRRFMGKFSAFLWEEQDLRNLFECICGAFEKGEEIVKQLGVEVQVVTNTPKRGFSCVPTRETLFGDRASAQENTTVAVNEMRPEEHP